jgi:hypothetical protein
MTSFLEIVAVVMAVTVPFGLGRSIVSVLRREAGLLGGIRGAVRKVGGAVKNSVSRTGPR